MLMYLRIAFRNLSQAPRRTFFLGTALAIVTLLLVMLLSLSQGLSNTMIRSATTLSAGHVNVAGFYKPKPQDSIPLVNDASKVRGIVEKNTPGLDFVTDRNRGWARIVSDTTSLYAALFGIDINEEKRFVEVIQLSEDHPESDMSRLTEPHTALIFESQAKRLGVTVGDAITLIAETPNGVANTLEARIVAVGEDLGFMSNWNVFVSKGTILDLYGLKPDTTGAVMVYLKDPDRSDEVMGHLRTVFESEGYALMDHVPQPFFMKFETVSGEDWTGQKLDLTTWRDEVSFLQWVLTAIDTISFFLVGILTVIIAVGIMNALWIAVRERTQEIGTLRAIGMRRYRTLLMFMTEALLLGFLATTLGALAGAALAGAIDAAQIKVPVDAVKAILMSDTINLAVTPAHVIVSVLVFTLVTGLSALWPAARASRMQPITAIHSVN